jgi:carboxyl-terminal processing protease
MTRFSALLAVCLVLRVGGLAGRQAPDQRQLNIESFEKVWTTIRDKHWDPKLGGLDWQAIHDEFRPQIEAANSQAQVRTLISSMVSRLGQSHFAVIPMEVYKEIEPQPEPDKYLKKPDSGESKTGSEPGAKQKMQESAGPPISSPDKRSTESRTPSEVLAEGTPGFDVRVVDGEALVTSVDPASPASAKEVRQGWQLLKIDGKDLAPILRQVGENFKESTVKDRMMLRAVVSRLEGKVGESIRVEFLNGEDKMIELEIPRAEPKGNQVKFGHLPVQNVWFESRRINGAGYIAFNNFLDPANLMMAFEKAVRSFMQADGVIIDLRGNPGGIGVMAMGMAGWFIDRPDQRLGVMHTRQTSLKFVVTPRVETYKGPLAILVDSGSASTSEILASGMKDLGRARIFGTRTQGAALPSVVEELPNGDRFQYAFANYVSDGGKPLEGNGVIPDVEVIPTREALRQGRDPFIEAALDWIQAQKKPL